MWIFTRYGFFSVSVQSGKRVVRARRKDHLTSLLNRFEKKLEIEASEDTDYKYRVAFTQQEWSEILVALNEEQTWSNFKSEVYATQGPTDYEKILHKVWSLMFTLQK